MASLSIDTYKVISLLQQQGYSRQQAEGLVEVLLSADLVDVATQVDIAKLRDDIAGLDHSLQTVRVEMYKVAAAQTLVIIGALVALAQIL